MPHLSAGCRVPEGPCLHGFILDVDINRRNCIKIIYRNTLHFSTETSHSISLSVKTRFFLIAYIKTPRGSKSGNSGSSLTKVL